MFIVLSFPICLSAFGAIFHRNSKAVAYYGWGAFDICYFIRLI